MILGIDLIGTNLESGTKTFNLNLLNQFLKNKTKEKIYIFVCKHYLQYFNFKEIPQNINLKIKSNFLSINIIKIIWIQFILPIELKFLGVEKIYSAMNYSPIICRFLKIQTILNIHSNLPWVYFNYMPGSKIKNYLIKKFMELSIKNSDKIIVNSKYAKKELVRKIKLASKKVFVNYLGVDNKTFEKKKIQKINFNFKNKYILCVSSCVRYHNFLNILKAFKNIIIENDIKIVFIMQILDKKYFDEINYYVEKNFEKKRIFFFQNIQSNLVKKFYQNSFFYIFSSYTEVFGLTSLEAMSNRIPVLMSKTSSLFEVNGNAALYFNPDKVEDISKKMIKIIKKGDLRKSLKIKGKKHINKFKWSLTFSNLLNIIRL